MPTSNQKIFSESHFFKQNLKCSSETKFAQGDLKLKHYLAMFDINEESLFEFFKQLYWRYA